MPVYWLLSGLVGYLVCTLVTARVAYGVERARVIEQEKWYHTDDDPLTRFRLYDQTGTAASAFVFGLAWPVVVPAYGAYRLTAFVIMARPPLTEYERLTRAETVQNRIEELEDALDFTAGDRSGGRFPEL